MAEQDEKTVWDDEFSARQYLEERGLELPPGRNLREFVVEMQDAQLKAQGFPIKAEYTIEVCSLCGVQLENDRDYGYMPLGDCPQRCGRDDKRGGPMRRFQGVAVSVLVRPV